MVRRIIRMMTRLSILLACLPFWGLMAARLRA